ncbi:MAG: AraC family transcriptional regulator [Verrucomicrobiota bacterium]
MKTSRPVAVTLPASGVYFAESVHAQDFAMSVRADGYHKLIYVLRGRVRYREEKKPVATVAAGALLLVPARVRHAFEDEEPSTLLLLCLSDAFVREEEELAVLWRGWVGAGSRTIAIGAATRRALEGLWRRALLERSYPRAAGAAAERALALQVLVQVARQPKAKRVEDAASRVAAVAREVDETFFERWTLDGAAERAGMSRRHFSAQFRAAMGRTFWEHLTEVRLAHAAELLTRGGHSITGVIFACGFGDVSQFYRLFGARFGKAPKAWAEKGNANLR